MDKLNIKFMNNETKWKYKIRIPENFDWFEIWCYYKIEKQEITNHIIIHKKMIFDHYYFVGNEKLTSKLSKEEKNYILEEIATECLNSLGSNVFTLKILDKMGFDVEYLKENYLNKLPKKDKHYILLPKENDDNYEYDILEENNDKVLGRCYLNEGLYLLVYPDCNIDIEQLKKYKFHEDTKIDYKVKKFLIFK